MPVPKRKRSSIDGKQRRTHWKLKEVAGFGTCTNPDCRQPVMPHKACPACGMYKGKQVIKIKQKKTEAEAE